MVPTTITLKTTFNDVNYTLKAITVRLKSQYSCVGTTAMPCIGGNQNVQTEEAGEDTGGNLTGRHRNDGAQGA